MNTNEVFAERLELQQFQNVARYINHGGPIRHYRAPYRSTYRARLDLKSGGVSWEFLCSFHARVAIIEGESGNEIAVIAGKSAHSQPFMLRCPLLWLTSGKAHHARKFHGALICSRGFIGSFIFPGRLAATIRAILALTEEREPIPANWRCQMNESALAPDERDDFWNEGI